MVSIDSVVNREPSPLYSDHCQRCPPACRSSAHLDHSEQQRLLQAVIWHPANMPE